MSNQNYQARKNYHQSKKKDVPIIDINELKSKKIAELVQIAKNLNIQNLNNLTKQELILKIVEIQAQTVTKDKDIEAEELISSGGVLEVLPDGYGFLRSPDYSYLSSPDDIYVSPSQIKRFGLRTGDTIVGKVRTPKEGEKFYALLKIESVNYGSPDLIRDRTIFDNLTPLFPDEKLVLETSPSIYSTRIGLACTNRQRTAWVDSLATKIWQNYFATTNCK